MQSSHTGFEQAGYPQHYGFAGPMPANSAHDMNKQVPAGQPSIYSNAGGISPAPQHHHQPTMAGPAPSLQQTQLVQQGHQMHRAHIPLTNYYAPRSNVTRGMSNMARTPVSSVVNQSQQQPGQFGAVPLVQPQNLIPMMVSMPQMYQRQYNASYQVLQSQPVYYYGSFNNPPPNANGHYFQNPNVPPYNVMTSQMTQIPATNATENKRPKKKLSIINPDTGEDIFEQNINENTPHSQMEKENENNDPSVSIQFATQVAAALATDKVEPSKSLESSRISQPVEMCSEIEPVSNLETSNSGDTIIEHHIENQTNPCAEESISFYKENFSGINDSFENKCVLESMDSVSVVQDTEIYEEYPEESTHNVNVMETKDNLLSQCENNPVLEKSVEYEVQDVLSKTHMIIEASPMNDPFDSSVPSSNVSDESKIQIVNVDVPVSDISSKIQEKPINESKKNKTKKKKDLNKRGENKEGGDMDAFLDKNDELPPSAPSSVVPPTSAASPAEQQVPSIISIVDNDVLSSIPLPGEVNDCNTTEVSPVDQPSDETPSVSPTTEGEDKENVAEDVQPKIVLKYSYKEDQWSPLNPEGKKQYDRDFLLQLQSQPMSLCKPSNLPNLDVIKDKAQIQRLTEVNRSTPMSLPIRSFDPFVPNFAKGGTPKPPHPPMSRRSQQGRGDKKQQKIILLPSNQNIKLHESENAWKPSYKTDMQEENPELMELYKKVRGILNKLTPQKFQTLVEQVKNLDINTEEKLKGVIDLIFEKAVDEPNFSVPYANMCKQLAMIEVPLVGQPIQYVNFRKLLLTKCQKEFEQERNEELKCEERMKAIETANPERRKELLAEIEEEEKKMRWRQLGNIRFIGELFKLKMLTEFIMHECVKKLLAQADEESLECLCRLLKTIGKELDEGKSNKTNSNGTNMMDHYFTVMQKIVDTRMTSSRVRFMLQDVIDLKRNNWIPRRDENNPKTIDQIHEEAEKEAREKQQVFQSMTYPKRMPEDNRRKSSGRALGTSEDGWTSSKSGKGSYNMVDPLKLKLTKPDEVDSIRLGPGGRGLQSWGRGSSGGAKTPAESDVKPLTMNRYSALADTTLTTGLENRRGSQRSAASSRESSRGRNSQMSSTIRKTPSATREKESLIEAVKEMNRTAAESKNPETKRADTQVNGKTTDVGALSLKGPDYCEEEIEKKTKPLIDEFLHNSDFEEAIKCIMELASPSTVHFFINSAVNQVLERSSQTRLLLGQLLCLLVKRNIITIDDYKKGLKEVLINMDDYAVDIPLIWEYTAELIEPLVEENKFPLSILKDLLEPCIHSETAGKLVSHILHCAAKKKGPKKLGELWKESGLQWSDFLGSSTNITDFVHKYKLDFTVSPTKVAQKELTAEEIRVQLKKILESSQEVEDLFEWIDTNVPESAVNKPSFIRALVTAVHEDAINESECKINQTVLKKRLPILTRYIAREKHLELQALYAIQRLMNRLDHPKGVLGQIFDALYDDDVITEETFKLWEQDNDQEELDGKAVALMSVKPFFLWLREAESEDIDEE